MPKEYNISKITRFNYSYEHVGSLLSLFSQQPICRIMFLLEKEKELEVSTIRQNLKELPAFVISRALTQLRAHNILEKAEKTYSIKNDLFLKKLSEATVKVLELVGEQKERITEEDIRNVADLFSSTFFDNVSNVLIHMLLEKPHKFNELANMYRNAHGFVAATKLRYHLSTRKIYVGGKRLLLFGVRGRNYYLTEEGRKLHEIFDSFLNDYEQAIEQFIQEIWSKPIRELTSEGLPLADPRDSFNKLLRLLNTTDFIIAFSTEPKGIITTKNVMNCVGENVGKRSSLSELVVSDAMTPIDNTKIIPGDMTLRELYEKEGGFKHNHYVVELGRGIYNVLSIYGVLRRFSVA